MSVTIKINGKERSLERTMNILCLMEMLNVPPRGVVVERNGEILQWDMFQQAILEDGDQLELIRLVGGG
jgi:thiamine biosynthesis protein ThiS